MPAATSTSNLAQLTFEQAADELEALVADMENRVLPLEEMLGHYERGVKLAVQCAEKLSAAEKRIEIIRRLPDGEVALAPLDPETAPAPEVNLNSSPGPGTENFSTDSANPRPRTTARKAPAPASPPVPARSADPDLDPDDDDELALF